MVMDVIWCRLCVSMILRKGELLRRVRRRSISSELLMCGGAVRSILLLPVVARCQDTIDVCIWCMPVLCLL